MPPIPRTAKARIKDIDTETFKTLLRAKKIRAASLQDVEGLHHNRPLYRHPNTGQLYTET